MQIFPLTTLHLSFLGGLLKSKQHFPSIHGHGSGQGVVGSVTFGVGESKMVVYILYYKSFANKVILRENTFWDIFTPKFSFFIVFLFFSFWGISWWGHSLLLLDWLRDPFWQSRWWDPHQDVTPILRREKPSNFSHMVKTMVFIGKNHAILEKHFPRFYLGLFQVWLWGNDLSITLARLNKTKRLKCVSINPKYGSLQNLISRLNLFQSGTQIF